MRSPVTLALAFGAALGWSVMTFERCIEFQNDLTLWTAAVDQATMKPRPLINLALARQLRKDYDGAEVAYRAALEACDDMRRSPYQRNFTWAVVLVNLAILHAEQGQLESAQSMIAQVRARYPSFRRGADVEQLVTILSKP